MLLVSDFLVPMAVSRQKSRSGKSVDSTRMPCEDDLETSCQRFLYFPSRELNVRFCLLPGSRKLVTQEQIIMQRINTTTERIKNARIMSAYNVQRLEDPTFARWKTVIEDDLTTNMIVIAVEQEICEILQARLRMYNDTFQ